MHLLELAQPATLDVNRITPNLPLKPVMDVVRQVPNHQRLHHKMSETAGRLASKLDSK